MYFSQHYEHLAVFEKLYTKVFDTLIKFFNEEPLIATTACLVFLFLIYGCIKLWKFILIATLLVACVIVITFIALDYKETRSLEYQLAMQMIDENCTDTIELEKYMRYENITFVDGRQYRYGEVSFDKIARNYVCHEKKRTYSVDFLLEIYANRPTFKDNLNDIQQLKTEIIKIINK